MKDEAQIATRLSRRGAVFAAVGALAPPAMAVAATDAAAGWPGVDAFVRGMIADRLTPGVQLAVMRRGAMVYSKGYGEANLETGTPVRSASVFRIGSLTKQFTAAAILRLQDLGKLSVDDRLSRFLPQVERAGDITLRQMLNHTSGLGDYADTSDVEVFLQRSRIDYSSQALLEAMREAGPMYVAEPGARFAYSNTAYVLLGLVVEKVTGQSYARALKVNVLAPAGLSLTAADANAEVVPGRACGYTPNPQASPGFDNASHISMTYPGAAGNLRSTAEDLCRWHAALLGGRVVSAASLRAIMTPGRLANGDLPSRASGPGPAASQDRVSYGFGLDIGEDEHGACIYHSGGIQGFASFVASYPDAGLSIAHISNCDGGFMATNPLRAAMDALTAELKRRAFAV